MTDQKINEAVAKSLGIEILNPNGGRIMGRKKGWGDSDWKIVPDYCHDLNAMHEVETALPEQEYRVFFYQLHKLRNDDCLPICKCISAPARQRAEAYLRVKGLWQQSTSAATKGM